MCLVMYQSVQSLTGKNNIEQSNLKKRCALFEIRVRSSELHLPKALFSIHWLTNKENESAVEISAFSL